jgi:hypothetical protein
LLFNARHQIFKKKKTKKKKKKMFVYQPLVIPTPLLQRACRATVCASPRPPPRPPKRRVRMLIAAALIASFLPYCLPRDAQPRMYKDGMGADERADRDEKRRIRRALYP